MLENDTQNIICNKCHKTICREIPCYMSDMYKNCEKMCTLKCDVNTYFSLENNIQEMAKS